MREILRKHYTRRMPGNRYLTLNSGYGKLRRIFLINYSQILDMLQISHVTEWKSQYFIVIYTSSSIYYVYSHTIYVYNNNNNNNDNYEIGELIFTITNKYIL